jgi:hypothetical protein
MKETKETNLACEFCNRKFARERTIVSHLCETKDRWLNKDRQSNRIAFQTFANFYDKHSATKQSKTYKEFIKSPYYMAFIKYANYCINVNCINILRYTDWLLKTNIKIDNWCSDKNYSEFIIYHLKNEDPYDAVKRSIEYFMDMSIEEHIQHNDCLRYVGVNKICYAIAAGKISPWVLYCSDSGVSFLDKLNTDHSNLIVSYIIPEQWAIKFNRDPELVKGIKRLLKDAGY